MHLGHLKHFDRVLLHIALVILIVDGSRSEIVSHSTVAQVEVGA